MYRLTFLLLTFLGIIFFGAVNVLTLKTSSVVNSKIEASNSALAKTSEIPSIRIPELTIDRIFSNNHQIPSNLPKDKLITIIATGDIIPARSVNFEVTQRKDFKWPYEKTADFLKNSDLTFINLETPLLKDCPPTQVGMVFCGDSRNVEGLVFAGIDVASLANNHAGNHGEAGVKETMDLLTSNGIAVTGVNGPLISEIKGIKFAFLGYDDITLPQPGVANFDEEKLKREIADARSKADVVVVTYHWGVEYRAQPDDRQKYLGHLTIDDGADLVIGNHPHWIQPIEFYKGKLITYAHGNFVFDQMWSQETEEGVVGKYTFLGSKLIDVEYFPVVIKDYGQPSFMIEPRKQQVLDNMRSQSEILKAN